MRSSFTCFERTSKVHEHNIIQRGYSVNKQLFHKTSVLRRTYRTLFDKQFEGWRTYWEARDRDGRHVFVKVYFGHDDQKFNVINGTKQVKLTDYFSNTLMHVKNVSFPRVEDHWIVNGTYFIAFSWRNIQTISLYALFDHPECRPAIYDLIEALSQLKPPSWWSKDIETHNFALTNYEKLDPSLTSPFDADLIRNVTVENDEKIYFHDFEKFQWSKKCLLKLHVSAFCYLQYLRGQFSLGEQVANELITGFGNDRNVANVDQGISTLNLMLKNMNERKITSVEIGKLRSLVNMRQCIK